MVFTFPGFGSLRYIVPKVMNEFGLEYVMPEENGSILDKGVELSPEEMCLPFKYMIGSLAAAYEKGADTVIMASTAGPCRLGEYGELMAGLLEDAGFRYRWIMLDTPSDIGVTELVARIRTIFCDKERVGPFRMMKAVVSGFCILYRFEKIERQLLETAGYLEDPREAVRMMNRMEREIHDEVSLSGCRHILERIKKDIRNMSFSENADPVKILVAGEIYTSAETVANRDLERFLASEGCSVERRIDVTWWFRRTVSSITDSFAFIRLVRSIRRKLSGADTMPCSVGGYGRETADMIIQSAGRVDGVIKIMPAGCMPEIVAKSYCEKRHEAAGLRILNLVFDEISGDAGYETRTEAFIDMLERRKHVLAGDRYRFDKHRPCSHGQQF